MIKRLISLACMTLIGNIAFSQQVGSILDTAKQKASQAIQQLDKSIKANYNRPGVTVILLSDPNSPYKNQIEGAFTRQTLPTRFDVNQIETKIIQRPSSFSLFNTSKVTELLESKRVTKQIVGTIFNENAKGEYDYQTLLKRARLNLDDNAYNKLERSNQGVEGNLKTDDWILPLVANTYINVLSIKEIMRWSDYYDQRDNEERELARRQKREPRFERRTNRGYRMSVEAVLFKVNLKDSVIYSFYEKYWVDQFTPKDLAKAHLQAKENLTIPISKLSTYSPGGGFTGLGNPFNEVSSVEDGVALLFGHSLNEGVSAVADLRVRQIVYDVKPIKAKIGTKEGLTTDDLYTVYENTQLADGSTVALYKGLVRAGVNVTDNSGGVNGSTEPSRFYQVAGVKIEQGMIMEQVNDIGLAVSVTGGSNGIGFVGFRAELLAKGFGRKTRFWDNTRLYLDLGFSGYSFGSDFSKLSVDTSNQSVVSRRVEVSTGATLFSIGLGFQKYFNVFRALQIGPYAGLRVDWANFSNEDLHKASQRAFGNGYGLKGVTLDLGIRASVALRKQLRIYGGFGIVPYFTNSAVFGVNKRLTESTKVQNEIQFIDASQRAKYNESSQQNPFYLPYSLYRSEFGIQFEF